LIEALACEKLVITTNLGEIPNTIKNGEHAILVNPNENEIAQNILELLANPDLAKFLGRNAALLVQQKYSIESIVD
jgi:glycosyltransferase involved in cell wall biosynthesis